MTSAVKGVKELKSLGIFRRREQEVRGDSEGFEPGEQKVYNQELNS